MPRIKSSGRLSTFFTERESEVSWISIGFGLQSVLMGRRLQDESPVTARSAAAPRAAIRLVCFMGGTPYLTRASFTYTRMVMPSTVTLPLCFSNTALPARVPSATRFHSPSRV